MNIYSNVFFFQKKKRKEKQGLACLNRAQLVLPAFRPAGLIRACKGKKICVMGSPSGEVCLDNISVTTSTGPVWVIFK